MKKIGKTFREEAIAKGIIPKARRPFAMFTQDKLKAPGFEGRSFPSCMREIAAEWHTLDKTTKQEYQERSTKEFEQQRASAALRGISKKPQTPSCGGVTPTGNSEGPGNGGATPTISFGNYDVIPADAARLGRGTYGRVVQAREKHTGRRVAIKLFEDDSGKEAKLEVAVYDHLKVHAGEDGRDCFCRLLSAHCEPPTPWMALQYIPSKNLRTVLEEGLADAVKPDVLHQVAHAVETLHRCNMIHLDIKPGNILWSYMEHRAYLIDFGFTLETDDSGTCVNKSPPQMVVTELYRCPELWQRCDETTLRRAVDVWSFGCVMLEVFSGTPLMWRKSGTRSSTLDSIAQWCCAWQAKDLRSWPCRELVWVPAHWRNVVWWCCAPQAERRPKVQKDVAGMANMLPPLPGRV